MPFPAGWPPRAPSGTRSLRFFRSGNATADFSDNAFLFSEAGSNAYVPLPYVAPGSSLPVSIGVTPSGTGQIPQDANPVNGPAPHPMVWSRCIRVKNDGAANLEFSFNGTDSHGLVRAGEERFYWDRIESGISVRGAGVAFRIEAW